MSTEMEKAYEPKKNEEKWRDYWFDNGLNSAKPEAGRKPFTIVIPPPNVTGSLHMGHALNSTLQDITIRFRRMQGYNTLWIPGTDHGGSHRNDAAFPRLSSRSPTLLNLSPIPAALSTDCGG